MSPLRLALPLALAATLAMPVAAQELTEDQAAEAMDFVSSSAAIDFCVINKLSGVHLVLKFAEEKCDIVMPVVADQQGRAHRPAQIQ